MMTAEFMLSKRPVLKITVIVILLHVVDLTITEWTVNSAGLTTPSLNFRRNKTKKHYELQKL